MGRQGHLAAQAGKRLGQLAADGPGPQYQQAPRRLADLPHGIRSQVIQFSQPGNIGHPGPGATGDDDIAGGDGPAVHLHLPGRADARLALQAIHPQGGKALYRIVRFDGLHHCLHPLHDPAKIHLYVHRLQPELGSPPGVVGYPRRADQGLAGHATGVQAVAAHPVSLHQGHFGLHGGGDEGGHQPGGPRPDDNQVGVETARFRIGPQRPAGLDARQYPLCQQGENRQQHEGQQQPRRDDASRGLQLPQLGTGVHIGGGGGQHAQLGDPVVPRRADG